MQRRLRFFCPGLLLALLACCFPGHSGSAQLLLPKFPAVVIDDCNSTVILPCVVVNLRKNNVREMFVKWSVGGNYFFVFNGLLQPTAAQKNSSFQSAEFVYRILLPSGIASLRLSGEEAIPGTYTCEVTESNQEGAVSVELIHGEGSKNCKVDQPSKPAPVPSNGTMDQPSKPAPVPSDGTRCQKLCNAVCTKLEHEIY